MIGIESASISTGGEGLEIVDTLSSRALGRIESSTSVTLRTMRTLVPEVFEPPDDQVEGEVGEGVAEVGGVVWRDAADVHGHLWVRVRTVRPRRWTVSWRRIPMVADGSRSRCGRPYAGSTGTKQRQL